MSAYLHMGHDTENLVGEKDLDEFQGLILSPVNRDQVSLQAHTRTFREKGTYDIVLDPQLYFPHSERGQLPEQPYFPKDLDSADLSSDEWWAGLSREVAKSAKTVEVDAVASPAVLPNVWTDDYFARCAENSLQLSKELAGSNIRVLTTVMVGLAALTQTDAPVRIASIVSEAEAAGYYLVIVTDVDPRRELSKEDEVLAAMNVIRELEQTGRPVMVSHCSSDMILFKAAGATHCASGKFFNLRRFTRSRYDEPSSGGGQLAYWFEHSLLAFLRGPDVLRLKEQGYEHLVGTHASRNYWSDEILGLFHENPESAWVAKGWRQYLSWFGKTESTLSMSAPLEHVNEWLKTAEGNWLDLEDAVVLFDEPRNSGSWIRPWRQALAQFARNG